MRGHNEDHRFDVQKLDPALWERATLANAAADYAAGYPEVVETFLATRAEPAFARLHDRLRSAGPDELHALAAERRHESLFMLVMMLTGACNADCPICFTDRKRKPGELEPDHRARLLREARALGARFVYVPGEGEPTIDEGFWPFLETCREVGLHAVVFTNGLALSDPATCRRYWGMEPEQAVRVLREYPVSFYVKMWSTRPELVGEMMAVPTRRFHFTDYGGATVSAGLARLMEGFPRERVGIEVVVEGRNADEVVDTIAPYAEAHGLSRIIEMIQHNGRVFNDGSYDPTPEQARRAAPLLSPTSCALATCKAVVTSRGRLSPRIAVLEHQIPGAPRDVREAGLYDLLHGTDYIVERRYDVVNCLCERIPMELAAARGEDVEFIPITNVLAPALSRVGARAACE